MMVMLVIMIIGAITVLISSLTSSSLNIERDKVTADALAKAKDALIGRAVADGTSPGSLPCPDTNDDGSAELLAGSNCPSYIGRLPWKTLGLPDLRDSAGERLWYALSPNFRKLAGTVPINSDTQGNLTITGTSPASSIVAIIFAPRSALPSQNQSRSDTATAACTTDGKTEAQSLCATNYLEGTNATSTSNINFLTSASSDTFNDQLITITHDQIMTPVEMRISREVRNCLDEYAAADGSKYPWAAPVSDTTTYTSTQATLFGRIPNTPSTATSTTDPNIATVSNALTQLLAGISAVSANPNAANQAALTTTSNYIINTVSLLIPSITGSVDTAGDSGLIYATNATGTNFTQAMADYQTAVTALNNYILSLPPANDLSMPNMTWSNPASMPSCSLFANTYWSSWKNEVFYQVADGFQPGSSAACVGCLTINGSGNSVAGNGSYRAAVIIARQAIGTQNRSVITTAPPAPYLEGVNPHAATTPSTTFETYSPSDTINFSNVNDLVLCVDGKVNCN